MRPKIILFLIISFVFVCFASYAETIKIIAEDDWYPYSGQTTDGLHGVAVDIVREAFKAEGIDVEFDVMNYDRGMLLVKDGKAIACFDAPRTEEIEQTYFWHDQPMYKADSFFYATNDSTEKISNVKDLEGKTLGLTQGYGYGNAIDMNNSIKKEYSKTDEIILKKLLAKRVDFIVLYGLVADNLVSRLGVRGQVKQVGPSEATDIYVAFSRKHPDGKKYCDIFSQGLKKIRENGTYQKIFAEWNARLKGEVQ